MSWDHIPDELACRKRWILWDRKVKSDGTTTKVPRAPNRANPDPVVVTDEQWHVTLSAALTAWKMKDTTGVGFVFMPNDPLMGIDLDHCRDPQTGVIDDWALEIIAQVNSYTEITPSQEGFHIICKASLRNFLPPEKSGRRINQVGVKPNSAFEAYDQRRFFTFTADTLAGFTQVTDAQEAIDQIIPPFFDRFDDDEAPTDFGTRPSVLSDEEVIRKLHEHKKAGPLWRGDSSAHGNDESVADMAFIWYTAFFANGNLPQIDRVVWQSERVREKWHRADYLPNTINRTVASMRFFYGDAGAGGVSLADMLRRYVQVYGASHVVDTDQATVIKHEAMRAYYPEEFPKWLKSSFRINKNREEIVFKPGGAAQHEVNLWRPLSIRPDPHASCQKIVELTKFLFDYDNHPEQWQWVMSWIALPLQDPKQSKLDTALVIHGCQGSGKSTLFEQIILPIYGKYGKFTDQANLEQDFNDWMVHKLLIVVDEVSSSAQDRRSIKNQLKSWITSKTLSINEKFRAVRQEPNTANYVFLSNELSPVVLDVDDRRFMIVSVPNPPVPPDKIKAYFDALYAEINNQGREAFYHYLLNFDLKGFNAHTLPYNNKEKQEIIAISKSPARQFLDEWRDGNSFVPFVSCKLSDLWSAYKHWAQTCNVRNFGTRDMFFKDLSRLVPEIASESRVVWIGGKAERVRAVNNEDDLDTLKAHSIQFGRALDAAKEEAYRIL